MPCARTYEALVAEAHWTAVWSVHSGVVSRPVFGGWVGSGVTGGGGDGGGGSGGDDDDGGGGGDGGNVQALTVCERGDVESHTASV